MADTEIISNNILQIAPNSCTNCLSSEAVGQNQGVSGNFSAHLNGSVKELLGANGGEVLPIDGKNLPQAISPQALNDLKSTFQSLLNDIQVDDIDSNILAESLNTDFQEEIDVIAPVLQEQFNILPEGILQEFSNIANLSDLSNPIEEVIAPELRNANELVSQIIDELNPIPIPVSQANSASVKTAQINNLSSLAGIIDNQRVLTGVAQPVEGELLQNLTGDSMVEAEDPAVFSRSQRINTSENISDELNDFIAKYLSEGNSFKTLSKNQALSAEIFQQNINSIKTESPSQYINTATIVDSYGNLNTGALQTKSIEAPIPLLIKLGAATEQVQQSVDQSIAQNVKWLLGNRAQHAKINVFPESLGQVNIALNLEDSNLKLNFIASSNITKELIEASISTLRSHFGESGINLQEVNVETRFSNQAEQGSQYSDLHDKSESKFNNDFDANSKEVGKVAPHEYVSNSSSLYLLDAYV